MRGGGGIRGWEGGRGREVEGARGGRGREGGVHGGEEKEEQGRGVVHGRPTFRGFFYPNHQES